MQDTCVATVRLSKQFRRQFKELKAIAKGKLKEGVVDLMHKETEEILIKNSRLAVSNSYWGPVVMGCIIISAIYFAGNISFSNVFFGWAWFFLAVMSLLKQRRDRKKIRETTE